MRLEIEFAETDMTLETDFGELYEKPQKEVYDSGYNDGYEVGESDGYGKGSTDGYNKGYGEGETSGYNSGYTVGKTDGYNEFDALKKHLNTLEKRIEEINKPSYAKEKKNEPDNADDKRK